MNLNLLKNQLQGQYDLICNYSNESFDAWKKSGKSNDAFFKEAGAYRIGATSLYTLAKYFNIHLSKIELKVVTFFNEQFPHINHYEQ